MADFQSMSHEQMLAWLDQANSGQVESGAAQLAAAAEEIRKIGEELKVRPQWVSWKGDGAEAFRLWAGKLANSTLSLADFGDHASKWLTQASNSIATAQASIPRGMPSATGNLAAAQAAHNDPDAAAIASKSSSELAALKADREKVRQEAAAEMTTLGQSYDQSAEQLEALAKKPPEFPPAPDVLLPDKRDAVSGGGGNIAFPGGSG
ncbi:hypothetical protein AB0J38_05225 [Streptomyces sp. NPDC050095]|uniref:hypothetical protein n=1 Tax=unclassified Streptomyces TaxID=2593676 RepID=UPI00344903C7